MHARCNHSPRAASQAGAALIVTLVLVTAVGLLSTAAIREATLEAAKTAHLASRVHARLVAESAIDIALAEEALPQSGTAARSYRPGPTAAWTAEVTIRFLGTANAPAEEQTAAEQPAAEPVPAAARDYYEIVAEVRGPRKVRATRKRDWYRLVPAAP